MSAAAASRLFDSVVPSDLLLQSLCYKVSDHALLCMLARLATQYLVQAWDVRNSCKHNGAVLPLPSAPEGRGADGVDAMA
jgi:hypothetical protein